MYAIVCEVKRGAGSYSDIPYFQGVRVDTSQVGSGDTVIRFKDPSGAYHEFSSVSEYLEFYEESGETY